MAELVGRNYWWPGMIKKVERYMMDMMHIKGTRIVQKLQQKS